LKRALVSFAWFALTTLVAYGQHNVKQPTLTPQNSGTTNGLIAVSPVNPQVVWASGRNGTFTVTTDGGNTWNAGVVPGAELLQFRDVEGVSAKVAYLMSIGVSGDPTDFRIYNTVDGGATWTLASSTATRSTGFSPTCERLTELPGRVSRAICHPRCRANPRLPPAAPVSRHKAARTHGSLQGPPLSRGFLPQETGETPGTLMTLRC